MKIDSKQIGEKFDIISYAAQEWKGETQTASTIKQVIQGCKIPC